jgi:trans-aconitate 2-methyltransferase
VKIWDPKEYDARHHYVTDYGASLIGMLNPQAGERVLDLGCGTGHLTHEIAKTGAVVVGIDSSAEMIAKARQDYPEIEFRVADAAAFHDPEPFDAVFSNAVLHWIKPPEPVAAAISAALKPGGRLVAEFGGKGNVRSITSLVETHPWYYPSIAEYSALLERNGLETVTAALFPRPTPVEGENGLRDWLKMFTSSFLAEDRAPEFERALRPKLYRDGVWYMDYVRLRITAVKPAQR